VQTIRDFTFSITGTINLNLAKSRKNTLQFAVVLEDLDKPIQNVLQTFGLRFWNVPSGCVRVFEWLIMPMSLLRREKSLVSAEIRTPDRPACSLVAVSTELTRIL